MGYQEQAQKALQEFSELLTKPISSTHITIEKESLVEIQQQIKSKLEAYIEELKANNDPQYVLKKIEHLKRTYQHYLNLNTSLTNFAEFRDTPQWPKYAEKVRLHAEQLNNSVLTLPQKIAMPFIDFAGAVIGAVGGILIGMIYGAIKGAQEGSMIGLGIGLVVGAFVGAFAGPVIGAYKAHDIAKNTFFSPAPFDKVEEIAKKYVSEKENSEGGIITKIKNTLR